MIPTNELRWVRRMDHVPVEGRPEFCTHTTVKVLQQKWVMDPRCDEQYFEWRDVPIVDETGLTADTSQKSQAKQWVGNDWVGEAQQ